MLKICFVSDRRLTPDRGATWAILAAIEAGVDRVQVREKDLGGAALLAVALPAVEASRRRAGDAAEVFVNGRFDVALAAGADGVHLPASGLPAGAIPRNVRKRLMVGVSTHSVEEAREAEAAGADSITFGPIFDTPSKRPYGPPLGLRALHEVLAAVTLPVYAIGGIRPDNVERIVALPVTGICVVSAIALAASPDRVIDEFRAAAGRVREGAS